MRYRQLTVFLLCVLLLGAAAAAFPEAEYLPCESFEAAARAAAQGRADYALLPVENSFAGAVIPTYALLEKQPLFIVGEIKRSIRHQLLGLPGASLAGIRRIPLDDILSNQWLKDHE